MQKKNVILSAFTILCIMSNGLQAQTVTDIDGNVYSTITSDSIIWMAGNLRTTRFNDGTAIPLIENGAEWETIATPAYCWLFNDESRNKDIGILYNWYAVETGKLCPTGWHVPSDKVFLNEAPWPGGLRGSLGRFQFTGDYACYWTSTKESSETAYVTQVIYDGSAVNRYYQFKNTGYLVRCIKDKNQD